jgi:16S rRNA (guanine1207-N2)-methyltransferase
VPDPVPHYFDARPAVGSHRRQVELALADVTLTLTTDRGVFSGDRVDPGTRLLLQEAPPPPAGGNLLDLGCGYGPMAVTLARRAPAATVWAVDVNERAVALCAENARANDATKVVATLVDADGRAVGEPVDWPPLDLIWSNPPIRVGKAALHQLLTVWLDRLAPTGRAVLVVQKHLGADSVAAWLTAEGWATTRLTSRAGYRLLDVRPRSAAGSA